YNAFVKSLPAGQYVLRAVCEDALGLAASAVRTVSVEPGDYPPVVAWLSPLADAVVAQGEDLPVVLSAYDSGGEISYCDILLNDQLWRRIVTAPYQFNQFVRALAAGNYSMEGRCTDNSGQSASVFRNLSIIGPQFSVAISSSDKNIQVEEGQDYPVELDLHISGDSIAYCEIYLNNVRWRQIHNGPYDFPNFIRGLAAGNYIMEAGCLSGGGDYAISESVTLTITAMPISAPVVVFDSPVRDLVHIQNQSLPVILNASSATGTIDYCELYVNDSLQRRDDYAPYVFNGFAARLLPGVYTLRAVCGNSHGLTATAQRLLTVQSPPLSGSRIQFLDSGSTGNLQSGENLSVEIISSDNDFEIQHCRLYYNGSLLRQENYAPYQWGPGSGSVDSVLLALTAGSHQLQADCTSTSGETAQIERTISVGSIGSAQAGSTNVLLDWIVPTTREDGSALAVAEIDSYVIHYYQPGGNTSYADEFVAARANNGALVTSYILDSLGSGNWAFSIATIDTQGRVSQFATPVNLDIP
ncbi:MAG: Ig-like domain-containing protein, partial [Pseudomonadales bacterium]